MPALLQLDPVHKLALGGFAALIIAYLVVLPASWAEAFEYTWSEPLFLLLLIGLLARASLRSTSHNARAFFGLLTAGFSVWLSIHLLWLVLPDRLVDVEDVVIDVVFLIFFAILAATIELRFDARADNRWIIKRVSAALGSVLMIFAVFGYFAIIPAVADEAPYETLLPLHAALEAYLGIRFLLVSLQADEPRWRLLYALFGGAFLLLVLADIMVFVFREQIVDYAPGNAANAVWYLWYPLAYVATAVDPLGQEKPLDTTSSSEEYPNTNGLLLFGFSMPFIHAGGYALGLLGTDGRALRDLFIACWLIVIGASILFLYRFIYSRMDLLDKRRASAESKADQFEEQLRRELRIRSLGRLSSGLAHDFGNTMTALQMHAVAAERRAERGETANAEFEGVRRSVEYAKNMVGQLKLFGAADERVETEPVALVDEVERTLQLVRPSLPDGVSLAFSHAGTVDVLALPSMVHQVVTNYVHNAIDAVGDRGKIEVTAEPTEVSVSCSSCGDQLSGPYAVLTVSDSGPGVSAEMRETIFEPLVTTKPVGLGSGLGLSSVHGIMHKLGGHVGLTDSPTGGACFIAYFPLRKTAGR